MATFSFTDQTSARIETATTIGLKSKSAQIEFDEISGKMVNLAVLSDEMGSFLNALPTHGNPFTFYLDVQLFKDRPIGGGSIEAEVLRVTRYNFGSGDSPTLQFTCTSEKDNVELVSTLKVEAVESGTFDLTLSLTNASASRQVFMADFPSLSGITLSNDKSGDPNPPTRTSSGAMKVLHLPTFELETRTDLWLANGQADGGRRQLEGISIVFCAMLLFVLITVLMTSWLPYLQHLALGLASFSVDIKGQHN